jgi:glycosyltransferase involved in cell wall biosynthesis
MAIGLPEVCAKAEASLIVVGHGSEISRLQADTPPALKRLLEARIGWATVSRFLAEHLESRGAQVTVLPAPVDAGVNGDVRVLPADAGLLVVARLTPLKGVERAIRLAAAMNRPLRVIGEGEAREHLTAQVAACGAEVRFDGRQSQSVVDAAYTQTAALLALSTKAADGGGSEGFGLVVVEASAHGVPVVVSDVGGLREAVGPGLVLASPDDVEASAAQIEAYLADDQAGPRQHAHVAQRHGTARLIAALSAMVMD